ncbi:MAG: transposase family protein [Parachlamydiaceae bacterium]
MSIPIPEGGIPPIPPISDAVESRPLMPPFSSEAQTVHLLAGVTFAFPKHVHIKFHLQNPAFKVIVRHPVVNELIKKFDPMISQLAVLANRGIAKGEKSQSNHPTQSKTPAKEAGRQRDEVPSPTKTSGNGTQENAVNIEVFKGEKGQTTMPKDNVVQKNTTQGPNQPSTATPAPKEFATEPKPSVEHLRENRASLETSQTISPQIQKPSSTDGKQPLTKSETKETPTASVKQESTQKEQAVPAIPVDKSAAASKNEPSQPKQSPTSTVVGSNSESKENISSSIPKTTTFQHSEHAKEGAHKNIVQHPIKEPMKHAATHTLHPHLTGLSSDETIAVPIAHRFFATIDNDTNIFVPPWLAILLPELERNTTVRGGQKKGQKDSTPQNPHKLSDILFMLLSACLSGANSLGEIFQSIESREKWFQAVLGLRHGLPPRQLLFWILSTMNASAFKHTFKRWLDELRGKTSQPPQLTDIYFWQTPLGYMLGQMIHREGPKQNPLNYCDAFLWKKCVIMLKTAEPSEALLTKIHEKNAFYIVETPTDLGVPPEGSKGYESYWEGQERIVIHTWKLETQPISYLVSTSEIFDPKGTTHRKSFYLSNLDDPAAYFFDLSRIQRTYERNTHWLLNAALTFPSMEEAIHHSVATLNHFRAYAIELILKSDKNVVAVEPLMKKAALDEKYLFRLIQGE